MTKTVYPKVYFPTNSHLYNYCSNNPVNYTDPSGKFPILIITMVMGGAISAAVDYGFQVTINYMHGKRGAEALSDINVCEIAGAFISGALTSGGIVAVEKLAGTVANAGIRKLIQITGDSVVSAISSVPGTGTENFLNNVFDSEHKIPISKNMLDNAIKSGISGGIVSIFAKNPTMTLKTPDWYKPNNIDYKQIEPNKYVRIGPMPGSVQAGAIQLTKDIENEILGQSVSKAVSNIYENVRKEF